MGQFFAGVVRKKYTLFCVSPDDAQVEIISTSDEASIQVGKKASERILELMSESFEMEDGFQMKIVESMESADDIPMTAIKPSSEHIK